MNLPETKDSSLSKLRQFLQPFALRRALSGLLAAELVLIEQEVGDVAQMPGCGGYSAAGHLFRAAQVEIGMFLRPLIDLPQRQ